MKKVIKMGVKPLAMATAFAAGTTASMIAVALPGGGDTLGAAAVVNESVCQQSVDMTIASGQRSVTTGTGICQLRSLPPTKGLVLTGSNPAGATVADSSAMVSAGGELYEAYVGGNREAAVLLTPNRALATSRYITYKESASAGEVTVDLAATVQPSTGLQASWLTGTYRIQARVHDFGQVASGLEHSVYASPNTALAELAYSKHLTVQFNGDNTCTVQDYATHYSFMLTKDPLDALGYPEADISGCVNGPSNCAQLDFDDYGLLGVVNMGVDSATIHDSSDWMDMYGPGDGMGLQPVSCSYAVNGSQVTVSYGMDAGNLDTPDAALNWDETFEVSADLRYLVSTGASVDYSDGMDEPAYRNGGLAVGVRVGAGSVEGKTYLVNELNSTYAMSTTSNPGYENPQDPLYQEEECASRGALTLNAGGTCSYESRSTCSGRKKSGLEETSAGAGDGTITDSLAAFDGAPLTAPTCSWSGTAADLTVDLGVQRMDGATINLHYIGSASDNGEALVLDGTYTNTAPAADEENPSMLPTQQFNVSSYMIGQQYTGDLNADADADSANNLDEFLWANNVTPAASAKSDYNKDNVSDIFWRKSDGQNVVWTMSNAAKLGSINLGYNGVGFAIKGIADFDADGDSDVLMRDDTTGQSIIFIMENGAKQSTVVVGTNSAAFSVEGVADFDGDKDADIFFRDNATGQNVIWTIQGGAKVSGQNMGNNATRFSVAGIGDYNGDSVSDIYFRDNAIGENVLWAISGGTKSGTASLGTNSAGFSVIATTDFDSDGDADILFRNNSTGQSVIWTLQALAKQSSQNLGTNATRFVVASVGDYNGDGANDIYFRDNTLGEQTIWTISGGAKSGSSYLGTNSSEYAVVASADFDGDADADVFMRRSTTGENIVWVMQGAAKQSTSVLGANNTAFTAYFQK